MELIGRYSLGSDQCPSARSRSLLEKEAAVEVSKHVGLQFNDISGIGEVTSMRHKGGTTIGLISGTAIGAGLMYLADPGRGNRRRSFIRNKVVHGMRLLAEVTDKRIRDIRNRGRGIVAEAWYALKREDVFDDILVDRVRAKIGRTVSHPSAIVVSAKNGRVALSGPVLESEANDLIDAAYSVRGVRDVESRVEIHRTSENVQGLQGGSGRTRPRPELRQENWALGTRLLVGAGGAIGLAFPIRNQNISVTSRIVGGLLLARAVTNLPLRRFFWTDSRQTGHSLSEDNHDPCARRARIRVLVESRKLCAGDGACAGSEEDR